MQKQFELKLPPGPFDAYLFDCDGTIADSMPLHYEAWNLVLAEWGGHFPRDLFHAWAGIPLPKTIEMLNERFGLSMPIDKILARKEEHFRLQLPRLRPVQSVLEHIEDQHGKTPFAVVSGSPRDTIIRTLSTLGLTDQFPVIVGAEDYRNGKPHPEPFLTAARILGARPERCLVFEDADLGIESARAAGMSWVRVPAPVHE